ncbi:hypothetical protein DL764_002831 [Monosporascus ibericus]|uniref:WW domain-containing protein n=1 Tax=Monosporascus ibericus TaxID=155417 RepID=A0A4Q4TK96_9PEZI|nr:hypothetical protein DL764_002831 [Monosporascus ibericus]
MSFLKKLTRELDNLGLGSDKKKDDEPSSGSESLLFIAVITGHRGYPGQDYGGGYPPGQGSGSGYGQPYQQTPPSSVGGYPAQPPQQQHHYGRPPPPAVGPVYSPPPNKPPIPVGWIPQYDPRYQRWYYAEEATGRTQWEAPEYRPPGPDRRGYGSQEQHGYGAHGGYENSDRAHRQGHGSSGAMLGAAAGGVAAGAIGGALLANALDEEHHQTYAAPAPVYDPAYNAEGEYVDQSDRESVAEARAEYEEALEAAADSSASSSEQEEVEEAYEDYQEEYEEAYGDDD